MRPSLTVSRVILLWTQLCHTIHSLDFTKFRGIDDIGKHGILLLIVTVRIVIIARKFIQ